MTIYCRNYKHVSKVCSGYMWSLARMGYVVSWYGRVVDVRSWTFNKGSWRRSSSGDTARCLMRVSWGRSSRWMQLDGRCRQLRSVESLNAAGWSLRAAEVGWVVERSWMIVAGSWGRSSRWIQLDDRSGKLRLVESFWVASWYSKSYVASCCNARAVRNSKSLRGLDTALLG